MEFDDFRKNYGNRLKSYVRRYRKKIGAPACFLDDLEQAAWMSVFRVLPSWKADGGLNAFNWCAGPILAEMYYEWRRHQGHKPYGQKPIAGTICELEPQHAVDESFCRAEAIHDMRRAFDAHPRPSHLVRFIMVSLSPSSGAEIGRAIGRTRQGTSASVRVVRNQLREAMG